MGGPGTLLKPVIEPSFASLAVFRWSNVLCCFSVKQRVLERQSHQLDLGERKLSLIVTEPETALATKEETFEEKSVLTKALDAMNSLQTEDIQSIELPKEWADMDNEQVKVVQLMPLHPEYAEVERMFKATCDKFNIEKIERVQNRNLWHAYQLKKNSICKKNQNQNNEKLLFHGTAASSLRSINRYGFSRGYAGKNAAPFGNGIYFAVDAIYFARNIYSVPDQDDKKYMYLARVLTGQYCAGKAGLIAPPPKNSADPTDLYDSVVNDVSNPSIFVIFSDIQAYPQYLITFK